MPRNKCSNQLKFNFPSRVDDIVLRAIISKILRISSIARFIFRQFVMNICRLDKKKVTHTRIRINCSQRLYGQVRLMCGSQCQFIVQNIHRSVKLMWGGVMPLCPIEIINVFPNFNVTFHRGTESLAKSTRCTQTHQPHRVFTAHNCIVKL